MAELPAYMVWVPTLLLVIFRVAGIFLTAPLLSNAAIPPAVKGLMSVVLGVAATVRLVEPVPMPQDWTSLVMGVGAEMLIGAAIGYAASLLFVGVELAAEQISQQMGLGLANVFNPLAEDTTNVLGGLLHMTALVVFLGIGGHRLLLGGLLGSLDRVPMMGFAAHAGLLEMTLNLLKAAMELSIKLAAPAMLALFLATVAMGFVQRTMPQLNILSVGFQLRVLLGLLVLAAGMALLSPLLSAAWQYTQNQLLHVF